jgi:2-dehydro-3-deoxy-D-gluconate 5-dehydrogenase
VTSKGADMFSLSGKTALVTGASRGLGQAISVAVADAGASVICVSSRPGGAAATVSQIRASGQEARELACDVSDREQLIAMAENAEREGGVDILVNNAGTIKRRAAIDYSAEDWDLVLRTNLDSVFFLSQKLGRGMVERKQGKIINIASLLAFSGGITVPAYTASKHAVAGLTKALANEWASSNVQVNAIAPGYFETDNTEALRNDAARSKEILSRIPAHRWGQPSDLTGAAVFLASRASDYVNGHVLVVDGGWMAR